MSASDRPAPTPASEPRDFIRDIVADDLAAGKHERVATRFPPEPNGYLHIGHAKSIVLNFGLAAEHGGTCNLRYDDTNPLTEEEEYVASMQEDIRWLGYRWDDVRFASDYFQGLYERAELLIEAGKAYVDSLSEDEIRDYRGTVTEPGRNSPHRDRSVAENLDLFRRMRAGEFPDGAHVLRARIDMADPNMKMRDPLLYRIRHADHYRTGDEWPIYPLYDFTHCLSDSIERITHSLCTLEFENNREVYDWILEAVDEPAPRPRQIEFARLNLSHTVLSKRRLLEMVETGTVDGWDDPRMPTLSGLRRRGVTPEAIRDFAERIGVARADNVVDLALLEHSIRDDLNARAPRVLAVLRPLEVVIENYPEGETEWLDAPYFPHDVGKEGSRKIPFSRRLYIEREDFMAEPPPGFYRLAPGREVRLRYGYFIRCERVEHDPATGEVVRLVCTYDPATRGGSAPDGRKVKSTLHWVSAEHALPATVRLYDRLFTVERPGADGASYLDQLNPDSLVVLDGVRVEPSVGDAPPGSHFQFERQGFFIIDEQDSAPERLVFNRTVTLKDAWARSVERGATDAAAASRKAAAGGAKKAAAAGAAPQEPAGPPPDPREGLAEVALERFDRYTGALALPAEDARTLAEDDGRAALFEEAVAAGAEAQSAANWIVNELARATKERPAADLPFGGVELAELVAAIDDGTLSTPLAKKVLEVMVAEGGSPRQIAASRGLERLADDDALAAAVDRALAEHPDEAARFRGGEAKLQGFFVGQVLRATRGQADPEAVNRLLRERLEEAAETGP